MSIIALWCVLGLVYLFIGCEWMSHTDDITMKFERRWVRVLSRIVHVIFWLPIIIVGLMWIFVEKLLK